MSGTSFGSGSGHGYGSGDGHGFGDGTGDGFGDGSGRAVGDACIHIPDDSPLLAWHYVREDGTLRFGHDGERVEVEEGLVLEADPDDLEICRSGLHASIDREDARSYCDGLACRVRVWGRVLWGADKLCAQYREVVEVVD